MKTRPLYLRTADALAKLLARSKPGTYLPSEPALARQLGVSRATLREAMRSFEERGLIVRRQGVGTYVTEPPRVIETGLEALNSIERLAAQIGLRVEMAALEIQEREPSAAEGDLFRISQPGRVLEVARVIQAKGRPVAYLVDVLPQGILPRAVLVDGFTGSILDLMLARGQPDLHCARTEISAVSATPEIARRLHIQRGDVLLFMTAQLSTPRGEVVDQSFSYFLPGIFRFHIVRCIDRRP